MEWNTKQFDGEYKARDVIRVALPTFRNNKLAPKKVWELVDYLIAEGLIKSEGRERYSVTGPGKRVLCQKYHYLKQG